MKPYKTKECVRYDFNTFYINSTANISADVRRLYLVESYSL